MLRPEAPAYLHYGAEQIGHGQSSFQKAVHHRKAPIVYGEEWRKVAGREEGAAAQSFPGPGDRPCWRRWQSVGSSRPRTAPPGRRWLGGGGDGLSGGKTPRLPGGRLGRRKCASSAGRMAWLAGRPFVSREDGLARERTARVGEDGLSQKKTACLASGWLGVNGDGLSREGMAHLEKERLGFFGDGPAETRMGRPPAG